MTIAIKRANGDLIWFDAVVNFGRQFSGSVSKHPLETGAVITDHTIIDNEIISISGVLSDADFNLNRPLIDSQQAATFGLQNKQFVNNTPVTSVDDTGTPMYQNVMIDEGNNLARFLPESIGQFFGTNKPTVTMQYPEKVKLALTVADDLIAMHQGREEFELINFSEDKIREVFSNCVMTSLSFNEDPDTGSAVYPNMTIERVKYATSTSVRVRRRVSKDMEKKAATQDSKGKQASNSSTTERNLSKDIESLNSNKDAGDLTSIIQGGSK